MHRQMTAKRKQQILIVVCCMVYGFAYAGRYGYNANIAPIMEFYGVTRAEAGLVSTCFFFAYGAMQLVHGILCRFYPKKIVIPAALFLSAALNLTVFFQPPFAAIKYLWLVNGICQSVLWPSLVLTLGETLEPGMMKQAVLVISLATMFGTLISYGGSALFNLFAFFRGSFLLGAVLTVLIGLIWLFSYDRLTAVRYAAPPAEETTTAKNSRKVLDGGLVGLLAACVLFAAVCNFVKDGLSTWTPVILKERFGLGDSVSIILTLILPVFGLAGSLLALAVNRKIRDYRLMAGVFYVGLSLCLGGLLLTFRGGGVVLTLALLGVISCLAYAVNNVVTSMMPLEMRDRVNSGFLAGLMNSATYIGSTASAYGLGLIADGAGWNAVILAMLGASAFSALVGIVCAGLIQWIRQ